MLRCVFRDGKKTCEKVEEGGIVKYEEVRNGKEVLEGGAEHEQRQDSGRCSCGRDHL